MCRALSHKHHLSLEMGGLELGGEEGNSFVLDFEGPH